jgi:tetratricopeptide (TPR) repeat protein
MSHIRPTRAPLFAGLALALAAGCSSQGEYVPKDVETQVRAMVDHGRYAEAVKLAADAAKASPKSEELQSLHREASIAYLLEQARRASFADRDEEALEHLDRAREIAPESRQIKDWTDRTRRKLAERWLWMALELHAKDQIDAALAAYESSLQYAPGDKDAITGRDLCLAILNHRAGLGRTYFDDGLHALAEYWLEQARSRFSYAKKYRPEDPKALQREEQVQQLLASERVSLGKRAEDARSFGAALAEYRQALALEPGNEAAKAGIERARLELDVAGLLARASMDIARGRYDRATELVEQATAKTGAQKDMCEGKLAAIREARLEKAYQGALALERDNRYEDAAAAYDEILAKADYYKDSITRRDTLQEYIKLASDLYAQAASATDTAAKLDLLQQIRSFWPDYKDIADQIRTLSEQP